MIDLHVHTSMSDGTYSPAEVVEMARKKGLRAIAITDHDTVAGVEPARRAAADSGVEIVPGVEMSTEWPRGIMHILGYFIDVEHAPLLEAL
ncbi:MAG: PHP domain-containing protein, partial [Desulfomonilaceae bacterium]